MAAQTGQDSQAQTSTEPIPYTGNTFSNLSSTVISLIVAAPFILTAIIVAGIVIYRRRRDRKHLKKTQNDLFGENPTPLQMEDNTIQKPQPAAAAEVPTKTAVSSWQEMPLRGGGKGGPWRNPWEA